MTQIAAIAEALIKGKTLSIMSGFRDFSCSNLPRELSRSIEQKFGVVVNKTRVDFTSKYGQSGYYFRYKLERNLKNKKGIESMEKYITEQKATDKTTSQKNYGAVNKTIGSQRKLL